MQDEELTLGDITLRSRLQQLPRGVLKKIVELLFRKGTDVGRHLRCLGSTLQMTISEDYSTVSLEDDTDIGTGLRRRIIELIVER